MVESFEDSAIPVLGPKDPEATAPVQGLPRPELTLGDKFQLLVGACNTIQDVNTKRELETALKDLVLGAVETGEA